MSRTGSSDLSEYWEQLSDSGVPSRRQVSVGASSALDVMDRLEAFVTASHQLELALKKERERSRSLEAELSAARRQLDAVVAGERQATEAQAQERQQRVSEKSAAEDLLRKSAEQKEAAKRQIAFLNATLVRYQRAWEKLKARDESMQAIARENKQLSERLAAAELRASAAEARAKQIQEGSAEKLDVLSEKIEVLGQRLSDQMGNTEKSAAESSSNLQRRFLSLANWMAKAVDAQSRASAVQFDGFAKVIELLGQRIDKATEFQTKQGAKQPIKPPPAPPAARS